MTHVCHAAPTMLWHTRLWRGDTNGYTIPEPLSLKVVHSGEAIIGGAGDGDDLDVPLCSSGVERASATGGKAPLADPRPCGPSSARLRRCAPALSEPQLRLERLEGWRLRDVRLR